MQYTLKSHQKWLPYPWEELAYRIECVSLLKEVIYEYPIISHRVVADTLYIRLDDAYLKTCQNGYFKYVHQDCKCRCLKLIQVDKNDEDIKIFSQTWVNIPDITIVSK